MDESVRDSQAGNSCKIIIRFLQRSQFSSESEPMMFGPSDDLVLKILSQVIEIIAVTCHADNEVTVQLRVFLRLTECPGIDHVELYVVTVKAEVTSYQCCQLLVASFIFEKLR